MLLQFKEFGKQIRVWCLSGENSFGCLLVFSSTDLVVLLKCKMMKQNPTIIQEFMGASYFSRMYFDLEKIEEGSYNKVLVI